MQKRKHYPRNPGTTDKQPYIVSYLIALYNKEHYIRECIESILSESNSNLQIEICIVDDGSQDSSLSVIKELYSDYPNIKIASFDKNKGKNAAYNKAFEMSIGQYICIFGADDIVYPKRTNTLLKHAIRTNKSVYGDKIKFLDGQDTLREIFSTVKKLSQTTHKITVDFFDNIMQNQLSGGCSFILREHANKIFPIPEHLGFEDWWISYHLLKNDWVSAYTDIVTIYRIHDGNDAVSNKNKYLTMKRDYARHFDYLKEFSRISSSKKEYKAIKKSLAIRESFFKDYKLSHLKSLSLDKYSLRILAFYLVGSKNVCFIKERLDNLNR